MKEHYLDRYRMLTSMSFLWLPPLLDDTDLSVDPKGEVNTRLVRAARGQVDLEEEAEAAVKKASGMKWATEFYEELLVPTEWNCLRAALEKGFDWDEDGGTGLASKRLFTLQVKCVGVWV